MNLICHGNPSAMHLLQSLLVFLSRLISQPFIGLGSILNVAVVGIASDRSRQQKLAVETIP
jgi:hypothetical protein